MKKFYLFQVIDLRFQVDQISPKEIQFCEEYRNDPAKARIFVIIIRHRDFKMVFDWKKNWN